MTISGTARRRCSQRLKSLPARSSRVAPELVYHPERLTQPLRRTRPKDDPDPGWQPMISPEAQSLIQFRQAVVSPPGEARSDTACFSAETGKNTNRGVVSRSMLVIDTALGGRYELNLEGERLSGVYIRGTTYRVPVTFTRS
jgi:anaerobic selenocysteine-containing dehydrogenase